MEGDNDNQKPRPLMDIICHATSGVVVVERFETCNKHRLSFVS